MAEDNNQFLLRERQMHLPMGPEFEVLCVWINIMYANLKLWTVSDQLNLIYPQIFPREWPSVTKNGFGF